MDETNCQSPSVWGSMQDLASWSLIDHENGVESAQNYVGGSYQWSQGSWNHSHQENNWSQMTPWMTEILQCPQGSLLKKAHVQARLKFDMIKRSTGWKFRGPMRPKSSSLASTQLVVFGGGGMLPMIPRTPSPRQTWRWKHYALGVFFC